MASVYCIWGVRKRPMIYVGSTTRDVNFRMAEHATGHGGFTKSMTQKKLLLLIEGPEPNIRSMELYIKEHRGVIDALLLLSMDRRKLHHWEAWCGVHRIVPTYTRLVTPEKWASLRMGIFEKEGSA